MRDLEGRHMEEVVGSLGRPLLLFHSPVDATVGIDNAALLYKAARHPKSFVSLDDADHLLLRERDSLYVGTVLAAWVERYLEAGPEPETVGGEDLGPTPYDLLAAALGACTTMTLRMYADRKKWPLEAAVVRLQHSRIHAEDEERCEEGEPRLDRLDRELTLIGPLDSEQRSRLLEIADRCPVHRTLTAGVVVRTELAD
ncbi:MAG: bifunctional alpha/beta hydrolase/OsmC family protein [Gemmatimonadota bacterium]